MLKLSNENGIVRLYKDSEEYYPTTGDIVLQYTVDDYLITKTYSIDKLSSFLDKITELDYNSYEYYIYYRPYGDSDDISLADKDKELIYNNTKKFNVKKQSYKFYYEIDYVREPSGNSDYNYVNNYMPKWSTAFKFFASNHSKLLEPFHTSLKNLPDILKQNLSISYKDPNKRQTLNLTDYKSDIVSEYNYKDLIDIRYEVDSKKSIYFGNRENNIYLQYEFHSINFKIRIKGIYKNQFIEEELDITSNSIYRLKNKYNTIYDINIIESEFILASKPTIRLANAYRLNNFCYQTPNHKISILDNILIKNNDMFKINFDYDFLYLDNKDNIYVKKNEIMYTSRLDKKIDLKIPKDITYNNSEFIDISSGDGDDFLLQLFLSEYMSYTNQNLIAVSFINSSGEIYFLNESLELILSKTPIYLDSALIYKIKTVSLNISLEDSEFIVIQLEDYDRLYSVNDIILLPHIDLIKELNLNDFNISIPYKELNNIDNSCKLIDVLLIDEIITAVYTNNDGDNSSKYLVVPLQYTDNINKDRNWYFNLDTEFLYRFFNMRPKIKNV